MGRPLLQVIKTPLPSLLDRCSVATGLAQCFDKRLS